MTLHLDPAQTEIVKYIVYNPTQWAIVHGGAGTGKSMVRDACVKACAGVNSIILGPTTSSISGIQSCNQVYTIAQFVSAVDTIIQGFVDPKPTEAAPRPLTLESIRRSQILIDDAHVMASSDFSKLHLNLCRLLNNPIIFGGIRVILFTDFRQLRPIDEKCFWSTEVFNRHCKEFITFQLEINYRIHSNVIAPYNDPEAREELDNLLHAMRTQSMDTNNRAASILIYFINNRRVPDTVLRICSKISIANAINTNILNKLDGTLFKLYKHSPSKKKTTLVDDCLLLKIGAKVQTTTRIALPPQTLDNKPSSICTGTIATVLSVDYTGTHIEDDPAEYDETDNSLTLRANPKTKWRIKIKLEGPESRTIDVAPIEMRGHNKSSGTTARKHHQWPLQLGFATTVRRVQGKTIDRVCVVGDDFTDPHELYTACSRVTSLHGLYCKDVYPDKFNPKYVSPHDTYVPQHPSQQQHKQHNDQMLTTFMTRCGFS